MSMEICVSFSKFNKDGKFRERGQVVLKDEDILEHAKNIVERDNMAAHYIFETFTIQSMTNY